MTNDKLRKPFMVRSTKSNQESGQDSRLSDEKEKNEEVSIRTGTPRRTPENALNQTILNSPERKAATSSGGNDAVISNRLGVASDSMLNQQKVLSKEEEKKLEKFKKYQEQQEILWGTVVGANLNVNKTNAVVVVDFNGTRVLIPDTVYFDTTFDFGQGYNRMSDEDKVKQRLKSARYNIASKCPFLIGRVGKANALQGGEGELVIVGSRLAALQKMRDFYFIHKRTDKGINVKEGAKAKADVVFVGEQNVTVVCLGVETRLDRYNLTDTMPINHCAEYCKVGDELTVRIKKIRVDRDKDSVYLKVSGRLNDSSQEVSKLTVGGSYMGFVDSHNKAKKLYTIILVNPQGVKVSVSESSVQGHLDLNKGDRVSVMIKEVKEEGYAYGLALKI